MNITDEIAEAAWCAFRDSDKPAPYNQVKDAIATVAPLIAQEAAKEIAELENHIADAGKMVEAQAKEIAELRAALADLLHIDQRSGWHSKAADKAKALLGIHDDAIG